jgi:hypothetical protein
LRILFYISGHGLGHAVRMAELMRGLLEHPGITIDVRTAARADLFPSSSRIWIHSASIDASVCESADALRIDGPATAAAWTAAQSSSAQRIEAEMQWIRERGIQLVLADIPHLAGIIATRCNVPAAGISNFTWNWILEPYLDAATLQWVATGYRALREFWQLPFGQRDGLEGFATVQATPLIAPAPRRSRASVRDRLGIPGDRRVVLLTFRGAISEAAIARARDDCRHYQLVDAGQAMRACPDLQFADLAAASDLLAGKLGYGLVAGCAAGKWRLLYVAREGFREDAITRAEAPAFTAMAEIPRADFEAGRWRTHLDALAEAPLPAACIAANGAAVCTERILHLLGS